ncbi:carbohydrate ABC transporter permease [bacterium]|nr:carbohydrate ABC transporter permease [bacterium]
MKKLSKKVIIFSSIAIGFATLMNAPFIWMILTSFKPASEVFSTILPSQYKFSNYEMAWTSVPMGRYIFNSLFMALTHSISHIILGSIAAFAFAKMRWKGRNLAFVIFLSAMMIPGEVTLIPNFITITKLGWVDTYQALVAPTFSSIFAIFLLRQFFMTIPRDLDDAAVIDGCGKLRYLFQIVMPLSKPALLTVGLFSFVASWNELLWPLVITNAEHMRVVQVGIAAFQSKFGVDYSLVMAGTTIVTLPIIILFFFVQRQFIEGISMSGLKG